MATKIQHVVSIEGVGDFTVMATSRGNACRKVFAECIERKQHNDLYRKLGLSRNDAGPQMSSRLPPNDPETGLWKGVSCSAVNEHCFSHPTPKVIGKRIKNARYARFPK